jgi:hypothetical protein
MAQPDRHSQEPKPSTAIDVSIWGISDVELLGVIDDLADENGWTSNYDVRMQLGENIEDTGQRSSVPQRVAWMRRYGWLEQDRGTTYNHRLTAMGHALLDNPRLAKAVQNALEGLNPAQRLALTKELSEFGAGAPSEIRNAMRREWRRNVERPKGR